MLKIAVLDDEKTYFETIRRITRKSFREQGINYEIFEYTSPEELLYDIEDDNKYHIYLLDVELPTTSGLEVAKEIRKKYHDPIIIYITNYVEYAVEGYEVNAYRYIPKKLLEQKLSEAYEAICNSIEKQIKNYFIIEKNHKLEKIAFEDIYYVKKDVKYVLIVHKYGTSRERITISDFYERVKEYNSFVIVDRSYVVNILHIMSLKSQQITLRNGEILPVSKPKLAHVKREIMRIWKD